MADEITATGPNGEQVALRNGVWVPLESAPTAPAQPEKPESSATLQGIKSATASLLANVLSAPHAVGELLAGVSATGRTALDPTGALEHGVSMPVGDRHQLSREAASSSFPISALLAMPDPRAEDVLAIPGAVARLPGAARAGIEEWRQAGGTGPAPNPVDAIRAAFTGAREDVRVRAAEHPVATEVGETVGDIATLLTARPGARIGSAIRRRGADFSSRWNPTEAKEELDSAAQLLWRGAGRAAEAGFDGAVLAALGDGDPLKTAAWSAGIQTGGSLALSAAEMVRKKPLGTFGVLWLGHEMYKAIAPGAQDAFDSKDQTVREMVGAYGLGLAAALVGGGRPSGPILSQISRASRAGITSVIAQLTKAREQGTPHYETVIAKIAEDPDYFGTGARTRLERAAKNTTKPDALLKEIDSLMRSETFRERVGALAQPR